MMDEGWWGVEEKRSSCDDGILGGDGGSATFVMR